MSTTYSGAKGKPIPLPASPLKGEGRTAQPLSAGEQVVVAHNKRFVEEKMPEMLPFFKGLYAEGLIDGWRSVTGCCVLHGDDHGTG